MRLIVMFVAAAAVAACSQDPARKYAELVKSGKAAITRDFNDPESAKFRDLGVYRNAAGQDEVLCGEVNGKNTLGAYTGYRRFIVVRDLAVIEDPVNGGIYGSLGDQCYSLLGKIE